MAKKTFRLDMTQLADFVKALNESPDKVRTRLYEISQKWGEKTRMAYASKIPYALGFNKRGHNNRKTFFSVEASNDNDKLTISVGHESFIARFLEVGTKAHEIPHRSRGSKKIVVSNVSGIKGSKALSNAYKEQYDSLGKTIETEINKILLGE